MSETSFLDRLEELQENAAATQGAAGVIIRIETGDPFAPLIGVPVRPQTPLAGHRYVWVDPEASDSLLQIGGGAGWIRHEYPTTAVAATRRIMERVAPACDWRIEVVERGGTEPYPYAITVELATTDRTLARDVRRRFTSDYAREVLPQERALAVVHVRRSTPLR